MEDLPTELRARAASYRLSGPGAEHTAELFDRAAEEIECLRAELKTQPWRQRALEAEDDLEHARAQREPRF